MWRQTPEAQYPDGYLGTLNSRRSDKLMNNLIDRSSEPSVHEGCPCKGERIDGRDYFWPDEFGPLTGLQLEASGQRSIAPPGHGSGSGTVTARCGDDPTSRSSGHPSWSHRRVGAIDPNTREGMLRQVPPWSTGRAQVAATVWRMAG